MDFIITFAKEIKQKEHHLFNMRQPTRLSLQNMFNAILEQNMCPDKHYFKNGVGIIIDANRLFKPFILANQTPFLLDDYRLGVIKRGTMRSHINLQEYTFEPNDIVFVKPGSIVEPIEMSDDFVVMGIGISSDAFHLAHSAKIPDLFSRPEKQGVQKTNAEQLQLLNHMFLLLLEIAHGQEAATANGTDPNQQVLYNMITTITQYFDSIFTTEHVAPTGHRSANDIFDRFLQLVNSHCQEHRHLAFYAGKICITERYLGTVIRQVSGVTAKEWIDKAVISHAKVKLRHSNLQVAEIAEALHFPNQSFFCKYFKRLVGCTPQEYREIRD